MSIHPALALAAQAFPRQASSALISSVWEGVLLVAATGLFLRLLPQTTARLRFLIWSTVFLLLTAVPVLNIFLVSHSTGSAIGTAAPVQLDPRWSYALTTLWLAAIAIRGTHLAVQAIKLRTLWSSAVPASGEATCNLAPILGKVQICTSTQLDRPSVIGFFAPRILIPAWLFDQLTPAELHQIVLHEMEHLRRRDDWLNLLQKLSLVAFPLNPALLWIDRRLATERELACDDGVLAQTRAPRAYATCLTSLAERRLAYRRGGCLTALALGAIGAFRRSEFSRRIESILASRPTLAAAPSRMLLVFAVMGMLGFAAAAARAPQLISFASVVSLPPQAVVLPVAHPGASKYAQPSGSAIQAHFMNAAFHLPAEDVLSHRKTTADPPPAAKDDKVGFAHISLRSAHISKAFRRKLISSNQAIEPTQTFANQQPERHWMVLTSWHEAAPTPVLLTLPDGRTILATYSAMPTQVDWLLVQL